MQESSDDLDRFDLLGLEAHGSDGGFQLPVGPLLCTPFGFLYGGSGIAACAEAAEQATGRPVQWITTQFLGSPAPGDRVDIEVSVVAAGKMTTQTQVNGRVGDDVVFTSLCAHNVRPTDDAASFGRMPSVPAPSECTDLGALFESGVTGSFFDHMERRIAAGTFGMSAVGSPQSGLLALWCRIIGSPVTGAATQGFVADLGPLAVCARLGVLPGGTSLDNTVRVVDARPSEWVLIELEADGFHRSVGHSTARIWSEDGRLMGVASQSAIVRRSHHDR